MQERQWSRLRFARGLNHEHNYFYLSQPAKFPLCYAAITMWSKISNSICSPRTSSLAHKGWLYAKLVAARKRNKNCTNNKKSAYELREKTFKILDRRDFMESLANLSSNDTVDVSENKIIARRRLAAEESSCFIQQCQPFLGKVNLNRIFASIPDDLPLLVQGGAVSEICKLHDDGRGFITSSISYPVGTIQRNVWNIQPNFRD